MKKKIGFILLLLVLLTSLIFNSVIGASTVKSSERQPVKATLLGATPTGVWSMVINGVTVCINKSYPGSIINVVPGSGITNVIRINAGQGDCSMAASIIATAALNGDEPFDKTYSNIASVVSLYPAQFQLVVKKELGVSTMDEIIAKKLRIRLSIDQVGSNGDLTFKRILKEYGLNIEDFKKWGGQIINRGMEDSSTMLSDGQIDGFCTTTLIPAPPIQQAALNKDLTLISLNPQIIDKLCSKYGFDDAVIPANTYKFNKQDVTSVAASTVIVVPKDSPDDLPYKLARSIHENLDYLRTVHVALKQLTPERMIRGLGVPLHPGALKYYREIGVVK